MDRPAGTVRSSVRRLPVGAAAILGGLLPALLGGCGEPVAVLGDTPGLMRIVLGIPEQAGREVSDRGTATELFLPGGLDMDSDGVLYVADNENRRIVAVNSADDAWLVVDDFGCATACFTDVTDLAVDGSGGLVVADELGNRLWRVDVDSGRRTPLAGDGTDASSPDGAPAASSSIRRPRGVAVGPDGRVYFAEARGHRVRTILPDGTLATVAGTGDAGFAGDGGPATEAEISFPGGLDVAAGVLFIADAGNDRIRAVDLSTGIIATVAGNGVRGFGGDGGDPLGASFNLPRDVAATEDGRTLYVADEENHRIRVVTPSSSLISTFAGDGETDFDGNLIDAGAASLDSPAGVAASPFGLVLISDTGHHIAWRTPVGF